MMYEYKRALQNRITEEMDGLAKRMAEGVSDEVYRKLSGEYKGLKRAKNMCDEILKEIQKETLKT